jgi:antagonist of KipI
MTVKVKVLDGGLFTTLQDLGRTQGQPYGVPPGGALDRFAHTVANELVGNLATAATLEIYGQPPTLFFEDATLISITGADFRPQIDRIDRPLWAGLFVRAGQTLRFSRSTATGKLAYLAIHGGWSAPLLMGSRATYVRAEFGGYNGEGRAITAGDILLTAEDYRHKIRDLVQFAGKFYPEKLQPVYSTNIEVAVVPGPHTEHFSAEALTRFFSQSYTLSEQSDRMGYRLTGTPLTYASPEMAEIAACGTVLGTIQVPPDGQPIVLMADHQVTGGYPIIGVVTQKSLPFLAQAKTNAQIKFKSAVA